MLGHMVRWIWLGLAVLTGCGLTSQADPAASTGGASEPQGGGGAGGGAAAGDIPTLCPSAGWSAPDRAIALGLSGVDVVVVRADGSRDVIHSLGHTQGIAP